MLWWQVLTYISRIVFGEIDSSSRQPETYQQLNERNEIETRQFSRGKAEKAQGEPNGTRGNKSTLRRDS